MDTSFNLKEARATWLSGLESRQAFSATQLEELDSHLEESLEDLEQRGLTPREAFMVAVHRLGCPAGLASEYQKLGSNPVWAFRGRWMVLGILCYLTALAITRTSTEIVGLLALQVPRGHFRLAVMVSGFLLCSIVGVWLLHRWLHGKFPRTTGWMSRQPVKTACAILLVASLVPVASAGLTTILTARSVNLPEFGEHLLHRRYILSATPLMWFALLVVSLRKYWGKPAVEA
jgi:hypothetical protein